MSDRILNNWWVLPVIAASAVIISAAKNALMVMMEQGLTLNSLRVLVLNVIIVLGTFFVLFFFLPRTFGAEKGSKGKTGKS